MDSCTTARQGGIPDYGITTSRFSAEFSKNPGPTEPKGLEKLLNVTWHPDGRFLAVYGRVVTGLG